MKTSESISEIAVALVKVHADLKSITKDATNPHFKNRYASLDGIMDAIRPVLAKHGLAIVQGVSTPDRDEIGNLTAITVETTLMHTSGQSLTTGIPLPLSQPTAQTLGSAITYGRRYGVSALLSLTADDDDGQATSERKPQAERPAEQPRTQAVRVSAPTTIAEANAFLMPFGKESKGKALGDISSEALDGARAWAADKGKFQAFQVAAEMVLEGRRPEPSNDFSQAPPESERDELPF